MKPTTRFRRAYLIATANTGAGRRTHYLSLANHTDLDVWQPGATIQMFVPPLPPDIPPDAVRSAYLWVYLENDGGAASATTPLHVVKEIPAP